MYIYSPNADNALHVIWTNNRLIILVRSCLFLLKKGAFQWHDPGCRPWALWWGGGEGVEVAVLKHQE